MKAQVHSLKQMYSQPKCWEKSTSPLVRFWSSDGSCWGFPFFSVIATRYLPGQERLLIYFGTGAVVIRGPKALELFDDFSNHRATAIKADGEEILSVEIDLNRETES
jgi:hypothetical protein